MLRKNILHAIYTSVHNLRDYKSTDEIEGMLFLLQYDYLNKVGFPLYPVKTYIGDNGIHMEYISDLLKVSEPIDIYNNGLWFTYYKELAVKEYYQKYSGCSSEEINMLVKEIISTNDLNMKYFVYGNYDYRYIKKARLTIRESKQFFSYCIKCTLVLFYILPLYSLGTLLYVSGIRRVSEEKYLFVYRFLVIGAICFIIWVLWTNKWKRPTDYELEHMNQ